MLIQGLRFFPFVLGFSFGNLGYYSLALFVYAFMFYSRVLFMIVRDMRVYDLSDWSGNILS